LVLVGGVSPAHPQAVAAAAGATDVLEAARQVRTLLEALEGVPLAIGTTARAYCRPDLRAIPVREAASRAPAGAAWVFGTEKHGLTREQLQTCHLVARIPSAGPSLNPTSRS
jgi:tRNA C32,U32 (ribose-2'-O)-methylase TrmJ